MCGAALASYTHYRKKIKNREKFPSFIKNTESPQKIIKSREKVYGRTSGLNIFSKNTQHHVGKLKHCCIVVASEEGWLYLPITDVGMRNWLRG